MRQHAFTTRYPGRVRVLLTKVGVCSPFTAEETKNRQVKLGEYVAIWDTGATHSAITRVIADDLGLKPTGIVEVHHARGKSSTNTYLVNISLPNKVMMGQVRVTEVELIPDANSAEKDQPQVLIGMDIIGMGDFAVTNVNSKTVLSFRTPSAKEIDFVPESNENNVKEVGNRHTRRAFEARKRKGLL